MPKGAKYSESAGSGGLAPGSGRAINTARSVGKGQKSRAYKISKDLEEKNALGKLKSWKVTPPQSRVPGADRSADEAVWPSIYEEPTTFEDQVRALKLAHINEKTGNTPFGLAHTSDKDWVWAAKKMQLRRALEYDKLFVKMWDLTSPLEVAEARKIYPEFFENRKKIIRIIAEMQTQLACIFLTGYKDKKDVDFLIELRMLNVPKDDRGIPLFLKQPVFLLNHEDAVKVMASMDDSFGGVDVSQMIGKTDSTSAAPYRTAFGFRVGPEVPYSVADPKKDFFGGASIAQPYIMAKDDQGTIGKAWANVKAGGSLFSFLGGDQPIQMASGRALFGAVREQPARA